MIYDYSKWSTHEIQEDLKRNREIQPRLRLADWLIRCSRMIIAAEEELAKRGVKA